MVTDGYPAVVGYLQPFSGPVYSLFLVGLVKKKMDGKWMGNGPENNFEPNNFEPTVHL